MPDKDLRKQALKGGKTTSRKAAAKSDLSSPASSRPSSALGSRSASRVVSREPSDDEDDKFSDDTNLSVHSIDGVLEADDLSEANIDILKQDLDAAIEQVIDRKGKHVTDREEALSRFNRLLMSHYFGDITHASVDDILTALGKVIKNESSPKETMLALRAVSLTAISTEDGGVYEKMSRLLKRTISDSSDIIAKAAAIQCLGACLFFGGAGEDEIAENGTYFLEIIQSDASFVGAEGSTEVLLAALTIYGVLLTRIDDVEEESEDAVEALMQQLDQRDVDVLIAAGQAIALLFEKSCSEPDGSSDEGEEDGEDADHDLDDTSRRRLVRRYQAYHNPSEVEQKCSSLAHASTKTLNKNDKRKLHHAFLRITNTVEDPRLPFQQSQPTRVKIHDDQQIVVNSWSKVLRVNFVRRVLRGGFLNHYVEGNKQLLDALPLVVQPRDHKSHKGRVGDRYRSARTFIGNGSFESPLNHDI